MTKDEALRTAVEALEKAKRQCQYHNIAPHLAYDDAITACKEALEETQGVSPEPEPVAKVGIYSEINALKPLSSGTLLYDTPPKREPEPVVTLEKLEQEIYENTRRFVDRDVMEWMLKRYYTSPQRAEGEAPKREPLTDNAKDAARYRWIRDSGTDVSLVIDKRTEWVPPDDVVAGVGGYWMYEYRCGSELDEAIDRAIEATHNIKEKNT